MQITVSATDQAAFHKKNIDMHDVPITFLRDLFPLIPIDRRKSDDVCDSTSDSCRSGKEPGTNYSVDKRGENIVI